jgi:hypothetical protein
VVEIKPPDACTVRRIRCEPFSVYSAKNKQNVINFYVMIIFFPTPVRVVGAYFSLVLYKMAETKGICLYLQKLDIKKIEEIK